MQRPTVKISDLGLAAALICRDHEMSSTERDVTGRTYFMFTQNDELSHDLNDYWSGSLDVKARNYFDNIKMLKSRIYAEK